MRSRKTQCLVGKYVIRRTHGIDFDLERTGCSCDFIFNWCTGGQRYQCCFIEILQVTNGNGTEKQKLWRAYKVRPQFFTIVTDHL